MHWCRLALAALAAAIIAGGVRAGDLFRALEGRGLIAGRITAVSAGGRLELDRGGEVALGPGASAVRAVRTDVDGIRRGQYVGISKGNPPDWILGAEAAETVAAVYEATGLSGRKPSRVGGIGTCTLYTPCPKCAAVFAEERRRRTRHPAMFQLKPLEPGAVRAGHYVIAAKTADGRPLLLVFDREEDLSAMASSLAVGPPR
jgi:hypothetical protein